MTRTINPPPDALPKPLVDGERMGREEFERRYDATPGSIKAELIEGVVYVAPPARIDSHAGPHGKMAIWSGVYASYTPAIHMVDNGTVRLNESDDYQPDLCLLIDPDHGGQLRHSHDDYFEGAPELVIEISASSEKIDRTIKFQGYRKAGVREYIIWRTGASAIDWFVLEGPEFQPLPRSPDGFLRSRTFPGLWLDVEAMLKLDMPQVLAVVQQGLSTPEHAAFVQSLARQGGK